MEYRIEKDVLGEKKIQRDAYWGIHTARALENFPPSGRLVPSELINALAIVKKTAIQVNEELGFIDHTKSQAMTEACDVIIQGKLSDQFPLDALQGGAGTSTNMNMNEVIANLALEIIGKEKGDYDTIHPLEDVNLHQSTNDVYPTALKIAAIFSLRALSEQIASVQGFFQQKEKEFAGVTKIGRTELQEAVPITLGAEFSGFAEAMARDRWRVYKCEERLRVVNLGGSAIGTGLACPKNYIFSIVEKLRENTKIGLTRAENLVAETAHSDCFVEVSGILSAHAVNLIKICNDLRMMNLLGEIILPASQAGSSMMPGKINPVICESAIQRSFKVLANNFLINECASRATFQINEFLPLLGCSFLESIRMLSDSNSMLKDFLPNIFANPEQCREYLSKSPTVITAFMPIIGYQRAQSLLEEFHKNGKGEFRDFLVEKLGQELVDQALSPDNLTRLGYPQ